MKKIRILTAVLLLVFGIRLQAQQESTILLPKDSIGFVIDKPFVSGKTRNGIGLIPNRNI